MNAVSLFSGIGGIDLALWRAGIPVVAAVEIDKDARAILARHFAVAGDFSAGDQVAQTVRSANGQPGGDAAGAMVRRLTPLECERLQGFPDGWTAGQSDSARYRQLGNAVAVPCVEWIARRIVQVAS